MLEKKKFIAKLSQYVANQLISIMTSNATYRKVELFCLKPETRLIQFGKKRT